MLLTPDKCTQLAKRMKLFHGLTAKDVCDILNRGLAMRWGAGETVVHKGANSNQMYVIVEGRVGVYDGEKQLAKLEAGEMFGEMALFSNRPRSATVVALESCILLALSQETLKSILEKRVAVELLLNIVRTLSERLRDANARSEHMPSID